MDELLRIPENMLCPVGDNKYATEISRLSVMGITKFPRNFTALGLNFVHDKQLLSVESEFEGYEYKSGEVRIIIFND